MAWGIEHRAWSKRFDLLDLGYLIDLNDLNGFNDFNDLTNRQFDQLTYFQFDYWLLTTDY